MKKTRLYLLALLIAALGLGAFFYKWKVLRFPVEPVAETEVWEIQARIEYPARRGGNKLTLQLPTDPPGFVILDENFVARGYGMTIEKAKQGREVQWAIRRASGTQALYYRATIYRDDHAADESEKSAPPPPKPGTYEEPYATARQTLLESVRDVTIDSATVAGELIRRLNADNPSEEVELLLDDVETREERAQLAKSLLADRKITARVIHGLELTGSRSNLEIQPYLQVYDADIKRWHTVHAGTGSIGWPEGMLLWSASPKPLLEVDGKRKASLEFSAQRSLADALETAKQRLESKDHDLVAYSLLNLPLQAQGVYRILLMVPLGAFLMLLLRNFVGIKTFGTFMPVLIALAFRETDIVAGVILFSLVVSLGLLVRFYLERLRLLMVPRLTAVLILVVLLMALVSVVSNKLGLEVGLSVALFPMIIMTMTIERMSIAWEERGPGYAIREGIGSLAIASICYLVMSWDRMEHLIFVFPELLLVLFGMTLLIGRYSGYRLTELFRFRALARDPIAPPLAKDAAPQP